MLLSNDYLIKRRLGKENDIRSIYSEFLKSCYEQKRRKLMSRTKSIFIVTLFFILTLIFIMVGWSLVHKTLNPAIDYLVELDTYDKIIMIISLSFVYICCFLGMDRIITYFVKKLSIIDTISNIKKK